MSAAAFAGDGNAAPAPVAPAQDTPTQSTTTPPANTQQARNADSKKVTNLVGVTVTGIRASLQASINTKRNADAIVDAITAEDIGKFPASNVAEALAQIPGITLDRSIPGTQRVSIDGIDPSLNLTLLDGHPVAQAIWLYGDSPNRGFNYSLLAPDVIGKLEVYKSPEARLPEGSIGGTVIMHTVKPLDVPANTVSGSFGLNYNDMVGDSRRQQYAALYAAGAGRGNGRGARGRGRGAAFNPVTMGAAFNPAAMGAAFNPAAMGAAFNPAAMGAAFNPAAMGAAFNPAAGAGRGAARGRGRGGLGGGGEGGGGGGGVS
ncbi:MAG: hypothetical protein WDW38_006611 [Sanguina aurantia]